MTGGWVGILVSKSVSVFFFFEGSILSDTDVVSLFVVKDGEFSSQNTKMESGDLFIEFLGEFVNFLAVFASLFVGPEFNLSQNLVGE
jgi:hypothetical protein